MHCREVQESIVESLAEALPAERRLAMERHIATCHACGSLAETHRKLDARLAAAFPSAHLSPNFRTALQGRIRRDPASAWPDFLPDLAHLGGCAAAILAMVVLLPRYSETVILGGAAFTCVTYFLQAVLRSSLEGMARDT